MGKCLGGGCCFVRSLYKKWQGRGGDEARSVGLLAGSPEIKMRVANLYGESRRGRASLDGSCRVSAGRICRKLDGG